MESREEIAERLKELLGLESWNESNEQEYEDLIEAYPVENEDDQEFLLEMGEIAFQMVVTPEP